MNDVVSVIVPVYNVADYLDRCIESICSQSYPYIQIIIVNDGSTDKSVQIIEKWREKDKRIEVYTKENGGLVSARREGISHASGAYSINVDGDDWIESDWILNLVSYAADNNLDAVCAGHTVEYGTEKQTEKNTIKEGEYKAEDIIARMLYNGNFYEFGITQYIWSKMVKTELLKVYQQDVPFEISIGEDVAVVYHTIMNSEKIGITDESGYHYMQRNDSICNHYSKGERKRCERLMEYLKRTFNGTPVMRKQLIQYEKLLFLSRDIAFFDGKTGSILTPFGGINGNGNVVIYGAGAIGRSVFFYLSSMEDISITGWIDKNYGRYSGSEYEIINPDKFDFLNNSIDHIIIAVSNEKTAGMIRKSLILKGAAANKILCLSAEFMDS